MAPADVCLAIKKPLNREAMVTLAGQAIVVDGGWVLRWSLVFKRNTDKNSPDARSGEFLLSSFE